MKLALNNNCVDYWLGNLEDSTTTTQLVHGETKHTPKCIYIRAKKWLSPQNSQYTWPSLGITSIDITSYNMYKDLQ